MVGAIVVRDGVIGKGHGTFQAVKRIYADGERLYPAPGKAADAVPYDKDTVPVMDVSGWSEEQFRAYVIADNRLALDAGWDRELLRIEIDQLMSVDADLKVLGFSTGEMLSLMVPDGKTDPEQVPDEPETPTSTPGDIWLMGNHRIICGDATKKSDVVALLAGAKPNLMVTDPPYGVSYDAIWREKIGWGKRAAGKVENDHQSGWSAAWQHFDGNIAYCWHADAYASVVQQSFESVGFKVRNQIIWVKNQIVISRGDYHYKHEPCLYLVRGTGNWNGDRKQSTVWEIDKPQKSETGHSTQKPVDCMMRPIINHTDGGDAVYEPFSGSGTTIIAAEMSGRTCFAVEIMPAYVDMAVMRWQNYTGKRATLEGDGRTFDEVKTARSPETVNA
jgi:DNA modification methylase